MENPKNERLERVKTQILNGLENAWEIGDDSEQTTIHMELQVYRPLLASLSLAFQTFQDSRFFNLQEIIL